MNKKPSESPFKRWLDAEQAQYEALKRTLRDRWRELEAEEETLP